MKLSRRKTRLLGSLTLPTRYCFLYSDAYGQADKQASRRAASAFFFELLVLGTKDAIKLDQKEAFGDVDIRAKEVLFAEIAA